MSMVLVIFPMSLWGITLHSASITGRKTTTGSRTTPQRPVLPTYICRTKWELFALNVLRLHIWRLLKPLTRRVLTGPQTDSSPLWGYSPPSPYVSWRLHCLGPTKGGHCACSSVKSKIISSCWSHSRAGKIRPVTLAKFQNQDAWRSASREKKVTHRWHHQNGVDLITLEYWERGAGSQMFLKKGD